MPDVGENWTCPYCNRDQVIAKERLASNWHPLWVENCLVGAIAFGYEAIVCANAQCRRLSFAVSLGKLLNQDGADFEIGGILGRWQLLPASSAKPQPDCVPKVLQADYNEACAIRDLSPKASATLSRRCLQGMIRHFCGISRPKLIEEIRELRALVDSGKAPPGVQADTTDAIDHVRSIGNIGAHMEADIDVIIDVDEGEAQALIDLLELLFDEWYVARHERTEKIKKVAVVAAAKAEAKRQSKVEPPHAPGASAPKEKA